MEISKSMLGVQDIPYVKKKKIKRGGENKDNSWEIVWSPAKCLK